MSRTELSKTSLDVMYLAYCALNNQNPERSRLATMKPDDIYALAERHSLNSLLSFALEGVIPEQVVKPWIQSRQRGLRNNLLLDMEGKHVCQVMDEKGIWHMRLKGSVLKDLYPRMEMRQMTDQDILFDTTRRDDMRQYMLARGYDPKGYNDTHHDIYHKAPVYNIELHHTLFELHCDLRLVNYYRNVKEERMIPNNDGTCGFHFSDEDFYIYMVAHAYKHYTDHGVGLRSLVDVYVFDSKKPNLDWAYIEAECAKLGMDAYERICRNAARKLFRDNAPEALTEEERDMVYFCTDSGTYGDEGGYIRHELKNLGASGKQVTFGQKLRYLWKRTFPDAKWMRENDRMARKHPKLLVLAWIVRLFRGIFKRGGHTTDELRYVMHTEEV